MFLRTHNFGPNQTPVGAFRGILVAFGGAPRKLEVFLFRRNMFAYYFIGRGQTSKRFAAAYINKILSEPKKRLN